MLILQLNISVGLSCSHVSNVLFELSVLLDGQLSQMFLLKSPKTVFLLLLLLFEFRLFNLLLSFKINLVYLIRSEFFEVVGNISVWT